MKQGKVWGETHLVFSNCNAEVQYMKCDRGHHCSKHCHEHKHNMFYVISGVIKILTWKNDYPLCDVTLLGAGERTIVKPNEYHQFEVLEDAEVLEVYWVELNLSDIKRKSCGGSIFDSKKIVEEAVESVNKREEEEILGDINNANPQYSTEGDNRVVTRENGK